MFLPGQEMVGSLKHNRGSFVISNLSDSLKGSLLKCKRIKSKVEASQTVRVVATVEEKQWGFRKSFYNYVSEDGGTRQFAMTEKLALVNPTPQTSLSRQQSNKPRSKRQQQAEILQHILPSNEGVATSSSISQQTRQIRHRAHKQNPDQYISFLMRFMKGQEEFIAEATEQMSQYTASIQTGTKLAYRPRSQSLQSRSQNRQGLASTNPIIWKQLHQPADLQTPKSTKEHSVEKFYSPKSFEYGQPMVPRILDQSGQHRLDRQIRQHYQSTMSRQNQKLADLTKKITCIQQAYKDSVVAQQFLSVKQREKITFDELLHQHISVVLKSFEPDQEKNPSYESDVDPEVENIEYKRDEELVQRTNHFWKYDRKGRNVYELQQKVKNRLIKRERGIQTPQQLIQKLKKTLVSCVEKMKHMRISVQELLDNRIILVKPYQRQGSYMFFKALNTHQLDIVKLYISRCRYYVYDLNHVSYLKFDKELQQTPLHIAARTGQLELASTLLLNGCFIDQHDIANRTPLWYAISEGHLEIIKLLLWYKASPWSTKECHYSNMANAMAIQILKQARQILILLMMAPFKVREKLWLERRDSILEFKPQQDQ